VSVSTAGSFELKGWHVLLGMLGFFGAVIAVDVGMAVQAYKTFPGEVSATPYEDGLQFNRTLAARAEERALGWRAKIRATVLGAGGNLAPGRAQIEITVQDPSGGPIKGLRLSGQLERPATEAGRVALAFTETRPGIYQAIAPETPGAWDLSISGVDAAGRTFDAESQLQWR
jgi:nitrogen fixation protein FixH